MQIRFAKYAPYSQNRGMNQKNHWDTKDLYAT